MSIKVVMVEPGKFARITTIENDLDSLQKAVDGNIQAIYPFEDEVALVCNEEGKCMKLPANRALYMDGEMVDIVCGKFFICGAPATSENFESLSEKQIQTYMDMFKQPQRFYKVGDSLTAVSYNPKDKDSR